VGRWVTGPKWVWALVAVAVFVTLVVLLATGFPGSLTDQGSQINLTYSILLLTALAGSAVVGGRFRNKPVVRYTIAWIFIAAALLVAYSFRQQAGNLYGRMIGELVPQRAQVEGQNVVVRLSDNGHFVVQAEVNGTTIRFLVDTGASDVVLSPSDARRLGFDPQSLKFTNSYRTANGTVRGAPVQLDRISIGPLTVLNVRASVNQADMSNSLLGMGFLERLSGYEVSGNKLTLKP